MSVKRTTTMRSASRMNSNDVDISLKEKKLAQVNIKQANNVLVSPLDEKQSTILGGGRLQFFKDGKFILELARSKAGEKFGWVSVPKKVLNSATNTTIHSKNDVCTSISDDNSSIQSSPWQRDHNWRKSAPRKDISQEMSMTFKRSKLNNAFLDLKAVRSKRRRPYDEVNPLLCNGNNLPVSKQTECSNTVEKEIRPSNHKEIKQNLRNKEKLSVIVQKLIDKIPTALEISRNVVISNNICNLSTTGLRLIDGKYQSNISPRKRILRELEKVTLDDSNKRSRSKSDKILVPNNTQSTLKTCLKNYNSTDNVEKNKFFKHNSVNANYNKESTDKYRTISSSTKLCSSYSIHSLLGNICNSSDNNDMRRKSPDSGSNKIRGLDDSLIFNTRTSKLPVTYTSQENEIERRNQTLDTKGNYNSLLSKSDGSVESKKLSSVVHDIEKPPHFLNDVIDINKYHGLTSKQLQSKESYTFLQNAAATRLKKEIDFSNTLKTFPHSDIPQYESSGEQISSTIAAKNSFLTAYPLLASTFSNPAHITNITNSEIYREPSIIIDKGNPIAHSPARSNKTVTNPFLDTCNTIAMSSLNYMYHENIPLSLCHNGSARFIPSSTYFHPYAIAAIRNPLWAQQSGTQLPAPIARLPSLFSVNAVKPPLNSAGMSAENPESNIKSELYIEDECNSDIPLNLSKH